ncbi:MAG: hypothetical protein FJY88_03590 [Candidatus Eisenbacteria bacterium]|nr:hypothetical protein [Candidatus Eisenbacteria bacterium]
MSRKSLVAAAALCCLLAHGMAGAESRSKWLHVKVVETGEDGETVRINLPIKLVAAVLPAIDDSDFRKGIVRVDSLRKSNVDLRALLRAVREAENGEYVSIDGVDERVRIRKDDGVLYIDTEELGDDSEKVRVRLRMDVLEALLSGEEDELNILAAVQALDERDEGDLITVHSEDETVRIWIDSRDSSD